MEQKYIIIFKDGREIVKTTADGFRNRLDVYNWVCLNRLGTVDRIECRPIAR